MSSEVAPLLIGFAATSALLVAIGVILGVRRLVERIRLRSQGRRSHESVGWATSQEWVYRPRVPHEVRAESPGPMSKAEASVGEPSAHRRGSLAAVEEARRKAELMLAATERRCERLLRESEAEAERRAGEITEDALRQALELLEEAELEVENVASKGVPARSAPGV
jgi:vacuolar-type H+-ATPase subunit H